jgi:hypothetical protein
VIGHYDWAGGREAMLSFGPADAPVVALVLPLFEEANRTRALGVAMLRALAEQGVAGVLPDLPGAGESSKRLEDIGLSDWPEALSAAIGGHAHVAAMRGGCLIAGNVPARSHWYFAPQTGEAAVRELVRARQVAAREAGESFDPANIDRDGGPLEFAGNRLPRPLLRALAASEPDMASPCRVVRLEADPGSADLHVVGSPLWRRAEPDNDPALAEALAADLADWVRRCES